MVTLCFDVQAQRPDWIDQPYEEQCHKARELCAVGEGQGVLSAELSARAAIARMFQTQIESETTINSESSSRESMEQGLTAEFEERVQKQVKQKTDYILEGAKLIESFTGENSVFALVSLNKKVAAKTLAEQIEHLDTRNLELFKKATRSSLLQVEQNFKTRESLHKHYRFLSNQSYPSPLPYKKVLDLKEKLLSKDVTVFLDSSHSIPDNLIHEVVSILIMHGYRVVNKELKEYDYRLRVQFETVERHLNVEGFVKYDASLILRSYDQKARQLGQIQLTQVQVGRNKSQALEKTYKTYEEDIKKRFHLLKLD
jgi:hypothetical protein